MATIAKSLGEALKKFDGDYSTLFTPRGGTLMHDAEKGWMITRIAVPKNKQPQYFEALGRALESETSDKILNPVGLALRINQVFHRTIDCSYRPNMGNRIGFKIKDPEYAFLSNLYPTIVVFKGKFYSSSENAYKSNKPGLDDSKGLDTVITDDDHESALLALMEKVVIAKFECNSALQAALASTDPLELVENTTHEFWGLGQTGQGANHLGKILMVLRSNQTSS